MNYRQRENKNTGSKLEIYNDIYSMVNQTLCAKEEGAEFHNMACLKQECPNCGPNTLLIANTEVTSSAIVTWYKFEYQIYITQDNKETKHLSLVKKQTPPRELISHLVAQLKGFPLHLFTARWQRVQWCNLMENLPHDHVAIEMDFSENYSCLVQEEAQSMHWVKLSAQYIHVFSGG